MNSQDSTLFLIVFGVLAFVVFILTVGRSYALVRQAFVVCHAAGPRLLRELAYADKPLLLSQLWGTATINKIILDVFEKQGLVEFVQLDIARNPEPSIIMRRHYQLTRRGRAVAKAYAVQINDSSDDPYRHMVTDIVDAIEEARKDPNVRLHIYPAPTIVREDPYQSEYPVEATLKSGVYPAANVEPRIALLKATTVVRAKDSKKAHDLG